MRISCNTTLIKDIVCFLESNKIKFNIDFRGWHGMNTMYDIRLPSEKDEFIFKLKYGDALN
jgi:hypothetical protein